METPALASGNNSSVSVGDWIVTHIVLAIPLVNLIMLFVWAFTDSTPVSKRNYCKAVLVIAVVVLVLGFAVLLIFGGSLAALSQGAQSRGY